MTISPLPPIPSSLSQEPSAVEWYNALKRWTADVSAALDAINGTEAPVIIYGSVLQSLVATNATVVSVSVGVPSKADMKINYTPKQEGSKIIATLFIGGNFNTSNLVAAKLLFNNVDVGTKTSYVNTTFDQIAVVFEYTPEGSGIFEATLTLAAGGGNIVAGGMTTLRIDEIRND